MATSKSAPKTLGLRCGTTGWETTDTPPKTAAALVGEMERFSQFAGGFTPMGSFTVALVAAAGEGPSLTRPARASAARSRARTKAARKKGRRPARRGGR